MTDDGRFLLVVNAGSSEVSVFRRDEDGLDLRDVASSGGTMPVSVTAHKGLVYVVNAGGGAGAEDGIAGFALGSDGSLTLLPGSMHPLSIRPCRSWASSRAP